MQQAAAGDEELVALVLARRHAQGDVRFQLLHQPIAQLPAGDVGAFLAAERRIVDAEDHVERRLVDLDRRQGDRVVDVGDGVADVDLLEADDGADVAGADFVGLDAAQAVERVELRDACRRSRVPSCLISATRWPLRILPAKIWPMAMRPT